jgi:hypothetical protein
MEFDSPYGYDDTLSVELMRGRDWLERHEVELGSTVELHFEEIGVDAPGRVRSPSSCPALERNDACLVTGRFRPSEPRCARGAHRRHIVYRRADL